ncbi:MAG: hypothetical protein IJN94_02455 [Clostridia bacterium]|nr:hypothetical protein [Clostridia bacterium]
MIVRKNGFVLDVDIESTIKYSHEHSLCDCDEDRNFYVQSKEKFPQLAEFLSELGLLIDRPDEIGSCAEEDYIDYHFVSYTVVGEILEVDKYEIDMFDGGLFLHVVIDNWYVPNEQETDRYFTVTVFNIRLPWVSEAPFPKECATVKSCSVVDKIKKRFNKK